jgi:chemotaxis protein CheX
VTTFVELPSPEDVHMLVGEVWASFLGSEIYPGSAAPEQLNEVISSVSIAGAWTGHLVLGLAGTGAAAVAQAMFGIENDQVSHEELADAVGELGNVIAGNIKSMLPEPSTLSLPQVVFDAGSFALPSTRLCLTTVMEWDNNSIAVSLWEASPAENRSS